ncbi:hypothetical protein AMJ80_06120 [bacterium SM23_31]|nr:MAG: hypothetical protein AMJ80_06120 [bacterium SM23_31]
MKYPTNFPSPKIDGTASRWLRVLLIILLISVIVSLVSIVLYFVLSPLKIVFLLFIIAALCAYLLEPIVYHMENRGLPRVYSILLLYIVIFFLMYQAGDKLLPPLIKEITDLPQSIQQESSTVKDQVKTFVRGNFPFIQEEQIDRSFEELRIWFQDLVSKASTKLLEIISFAQGILSLAIQIIMVPLIAFFILKDGPALKRAVVNLIPNRFFEVSLHLLYKTDQQIGRYLRGQILDNFILAVLYSISFYFMDIPYFIIFGAFSGIANVVPYIGPLIGIIPPLIVSIMGKGSLGVIPWIILIFIFIQIIDVTLVQPTVVAKSVDLHPLIVIFAVLAGGILLGVIGMLFAVLLAGVIKVIITEIAWSIRNYRLGP